MTDLLSLVRRYSDAIQDGRTPEVIFTHLQDEAAELSTEISSRIPGEDGVAGEAIDVMLCALDLVFKARPDWTDADIAAYAERKCQKWAAKHSE